MDVHLSYSPWARHNLGTIWGGQKIWSINLLVGNVIGLVSVYICICHQKKIVIERTRDLIYLKFVAKDFPLKIISPSAGENSGDSA